MLTLLATALLSSSASGAAHAPPGRQSPPPGLKNIEMAPSSDGRPRLLILRSPDLVPPMGEADFDKNKAGALAAALSFLRSRSSAKYVVFTPKPSQMQPAFQQAQLSKAAFDPAENPTKIYPERPMQDLGQILGTPYVMYVAWSRAHTIYFHPPIYTSAGEPPTYAGMGEPIVDLVAGYTVFDVRDGKYLTTLRLVAVKSTPSDGPADFVKAMKAYDFGKTMAKKIGEYMGQLIYDDMQKLPFKP